MTTTNPQHTATRELPGNTTRILSKTLSENCLPIGTVLGEFEITGVIGEGGFGTVYLATDLALQRTVAIKEYMPGALAERGSDKSVIVRSQRHQETFAIGLKSFINEARLLAQFDHPALIKVHRFWEENKTGYMAMRYYEGETLKETIKNNPQRINEASLKSMLKPVLEALETLYKVQVLHRDVSPDNIMIQPNGEAVLLDFGAARQVLGESTQALTVILKPGYAPIEQYADDTSMKQGPWTDIYALSAVLFYAIIKKPPPTSVARMLKDSIEPLHRQAPAGFSHEFLAAIDHGLCINPADRPQSIDAFRQMLGLSATIAQFTDPAPPTPAAGRATTSVGVAKPVPAPVKPLTMPQISDVDEKNRTSDPDRQKKANHSNTSSNTTPRSIGTPLGKDAKPAIRRFHPGLLAMSALMFLFITAAAIFHFSPGSTKPAAPPPPPIVLAPVAAPPVMPAPEPSSAAAVAITEPSASIPPLTGTEPVTEPAKVDEETIAWTILAGNVEVKALDLINFIEKYPSGKYTQAARGKLVVINAKAKPVASITNSAAIEPSIAKPKGTVTLAIVPWGKIIVNGVSRGLSPPMKKLTLPEGSHQIRIVNPNFPDFVTQIDIAKDGVGYINHEFSLKN